MKLPLKKSLFILIVFVCCGLVSSEAGVLLSDSAPTTDVIWTNHTPAGSGNFATASNKTNTQEGGIAFSLDAALEINAITFYTGNVGAGAPGAAFHISIIEFTKIPSLSTDIDETDPSTPTFTYTTKYSEGMTMPSTAEGLAVDKYITFSLSDTVSLDAGKTYGVLLTFDTSASGRDFGLRNVDSSQALGTVANFRTQYTTSTSSYTYTIRSTEAYFAIHGIPEPSTVFFIGLSSLFAVGFLRRRRSKC